MICVGMVVCFLYAVYAVIMIFNLFCFCYCYYFGGPAWFWLVCYMNGLGFCFVVSSGLWQLWILFWGFT